MGSFREFVTNEKQRLAQKKQAIVKSEKEKRMAELVAFSQNFKVRPSSLFLLRVFDFLFRLEF